MQRKYLGTPCWTVAFIVVLFISSSVTGQKIARPLKFDEVVVYGTDASGLEEKSTRRMPRLIKKVRSMRGSHVTIIEYYAQISMYDVERALDNAAGGAASALREVRRSVYSDTTKIVRGGFRDQATIEYWIVPKGAPDPDPTPQYSEEESVRCPNFNVFDSYNFSYDDPASFSVFRYPNDGGTYRWTVSRGQIMEGQGTSSIRVKPDGAKRLTVTVEAEDLSPACSRGRRKDFEIGPRAYLSDRVDGYNFSDLSARIDGFMTILNSNPTWEGYLVGYAGRGKNDSIERERALASARRTIAFRRYSSERLHLVDGGTREERSVDFWIVPPGVSPPKPSPSVDPFFIRKTGKRIFFDE
jgi:hypothetical protein